MKPPIDLEVFFHATRKARLNPDPSSVAEGFESRLQSRLTAVEYEICGLGLWKWSLPALGGALVFSVSAWLVLQSTIAMLIDTMVIDGWIWMIQ